MPSRSAKPDPADQPGTPAAAKPTLDEIEAANAQRGLANYRQPDLTDEAAGPAEPHEEVRG
jgi:hypothetical protein